MKKIKSQFGETIGETLVALLIAALALVMLAGAVTTSLGVVNKGRAKMDDYYKTMQSSGLVNRGDSDNKGIVTIADSAERISAQSINVTYYENNEFDNNPVIAYKAEIS